MKYYCARCGKELLNGYHILNGKRVCRDDRNCYRKRKSLASAGTTNKA